ncbi:MAG TPA: hypothetical protein VJH37_02430 [Candidatus Nanoarchaeia archaeon]|nr:hypothetical protein [Candidatus Nanoarchaeia archaeon]
MPMHISQKTVAFLLCLTIVTVLGSFITLLEKLGTNSALTGFATFDTGVVNVTIQSTVDINLAVDNVDFGSGTINTIGLNTSLNTSDTAWGGGNNPNGFSDPGPFQVRNDGNVDVNISVNSSNTASSFIGGTNPGYYFVASPVGTDDGCVANMTNNATPRGFSSSTLEICQNLTFGDAADTLNISIFVDIPSDAATGLKTDSGFQVHAERTV